MTGDRLARDLFAGLAVAFIAIRLANLEPWTQSVDAFAYWSTRAGLHYDQSTVGSLGSYLYSPAFAHLLAPVTWLPWPAFDGLWTTVNVAILWALLGRWSLPALLFLPIPFELIAGNVHLIYALVAVVGLRYPALWVIPLITKVTPGVGLLWFAVRREWRSLAIAVGLTAAVGLVSWLIDPAAWRAWIGVLEGGSSDPAGTQGTFIAIPLLPRLVVAAAVTVWGALTDRPWVLPIAMTLALPVLWLNGFATLVGLGPTILARFRGHDRPVLVAPFIQPASSRA